MRFFSLLSAVLLSATYALAKSTDGHATIVLNGQTFNPADGQEIKLDKQSTPISGPVLFRGIHLNFDINVTDLSVRNYILTGASHPLRLVTQPTLIFPLQSNNLSSSLIANPTLSRLEIKDDKVVLIINVKGGSWKVQVLDSTQGGNLQIEPEFGTISFEFTRTLGPTVFYFINEFTGKINFGNGIDAVSQAQDPVNFHQMLLGKDSPEAATQTFQDGTTSKWIIQSGGRVGAVLGEDAIEESPGSNNCTSQCQNRDRIRGSVPVPPDPTNPTPLPSIQTAAP